MFNSFSIFFFLICRALYANHFNEQYNTKIENASNIFISGKHAQKIKEFHIDDRITCTQKYLPIAFKMRVDNTTTDVKGWLTEHGNLVNHQANSSSCRLFKKLKNI